MLGCKECADSNCLALCETNLKQGGWVVEATFWVAESMEHCLGGECLWALSSCIRSSRTTAGKLSTPPKEAERDSILGAFVTAPP